MRRSHRYAGGEHWSQKTKQTETDALMRLAMAIQMAILCQVWFTRRRRNDQGPLRDRHADDQQSLPNTLKQDSFDEIINDGDVEHILTEAILGGDGGEDGIAEKEDLLAHQDPWLNRTRKTPSHEGFRHSALVL